MAKSSDWKGFERRIAKRFRGFRVIRVARHVHDLDVVAEPFGIECKYARRFSHIQALEQCEQVVDDVADREHLIPIAVCAHPGTVGQETVAIRMMAFSELFCCGECNTEIEGEMIVLPLNIFLDFLDRAGVPYGTKKGD